jgi:hypothetical protein
MRTREQRDRNGDEQVQREGAAEVTAMLASAPFPSSCR